MLSAKFPVFLLTLLFSLSSPALEGNADFWHSSIAAKAEGKAFTQAQKREILNANRTRNAGELRSDLSRERLVPSQKSQKGVTPSPNEAQVDHIFPRSQGGQNPIDNAQVLSRRENRLKSDKVP